jgi:hypothetical protein
VQANDECLNKSWFWDLFDARRQIEAMNGGYIRVWDIERPNAGGICAAGRPFVLTLT